MDQSSVKSVTQWIVRLKADDDEAARRLWERYCSRLGELARKKLAGAPRRAADEEDVALSAFNSLCLGARTGRFPKLSDRNDLWQLLLVITERKAIDQIKYENRAKRGGGQVRGESAFLKPADEAAVRAIEQVINNEPTPEFTAIAVEEYQRLLDRLPNESLRKVAVWKMEGNTSEEIAEKLGCVVRTIERKLKGIREVWSRELPT